MTEQAILVSLPLGPLGWLYRIARLWLRLAGLGGKPLPQDLGVKVSTAVLDVSAAGPASMSLIPGQRDAAIFIEDDHLSYQKEGIEGLQGVKAGDAFSFANEGAGLWLTGVGGSHSDYSLGCTHQDVTLAEWILRTENQQIVYGRPPTPLQWFVKGIGGGEVEVDLTTQVNGTVFSRGRKYLRAYWCCLYVRARPVLTVGPALIQSEE